MSFLDTLKNIGSNIISGAKDFLGMGGGKASLGAYAPYGFTPNKEEVGMIQNYPTLSSPPPSADSGILQVYKVPSASSPNYEYKEVVRPIISNYDNGLINQPQATLAQPSAPYVPYVAPGQSGAYQSTEQKAQSQAQKIAQQQAVINQQVQQDRASQTYGPSTGGATNTGPSGFGTSGTIIGPSATQGIINNQVNQEEQKKKQPQFKGLVSLDQARQMGLTGAGQSGVFKDQQGDFYGISNAQVANTFTPNATGKLDVTQNVVGTAAPFQTSLATGPVYADQLSGAGGNKLTKAPIEWYKDLQTAVDNSLASQPPVPTQPVVETANQQAFVKNSSDPYGLQAAMDASRLKNGLPDLENQRIQTMRNIQALNEGLQKIVKDINDNPDYPKSLAARLITDFSNKNAITLQNLQGQLQITNTQIDQANSAVDREFGIAEKNLTLQQNQQDQQKADVKNQLNTLISSGAIGEMSDSELSQWASSAGYTLSSLQAIKKAKTASEDKYDSTYTNDEGNDLVFYGVNKKTGVVEEIKRVKGGATPKTTTTKTDESFTRLEQLVKQNPATGEVGGRNNVANGKQWDAVAAKIDAEYGAGTATKYDNYLSSTYGGAVAKAKLTPDQQGIINDAKAAIDTVKQQYGDWSGTRQQIIERSKQQYNFDISPYI